MATLALMASPLFMNALAGNTAPLPTQQAPQTGRGENDKKSRRNKTRNRDRREAQRLQQAPPGLPGLPGVSTAQRAQAPRTPDEIFMGGLDHLHGLLGLTNSLTPGGGQLGGLIDSVGLLRSGADPLSAGLPVQRQLLQGSFLPPDLAGEFATAMRGARQTISLAKSGELERSSKPSFWETLGNAVFKGLGSVVTGGIATVLSGGTLGLPSLIGAGLTIGGELLGGLLKK